MPTSVFACVGNQYAAVLQQALASHYSSECAAPPAKVTYLQAWFSITSIQELHFERYVECTECSSAVSSSNMITMCGI